MKGEEAFGTLGKKAWEFVDFIERSQQKIWQLLPLTQTDSFLSPYSSPDSFAANHLLIDLKILDENLFLSESDWKSVNVKDVKIYRESKERLLRKLFNSWYSIEKNKKELEKYYEEQEWWIKDHVKYYLHLNKDEDRNYLVFLQKIFMDQYIPLKKYANDKGIVLFGDLPFYVNYNSRDVFVQGNNFDLDKKGSPRFQAAVPPDDFQEKGQLWGTPVYDWKKLEEDRFSYWVKKIRRQEDFYDYLRIDHFRGLESFYQVPWNAEDGTKGEWIKAPGEKLLQTLKRKSKIKLIAENLGYITPEVEYLLEKFNIPGMKILQFSLEDLYLKSEKSDTVYYTGTHDNQTLLSWIREKYSPEEELEKDLIWDFIKKVYYSKAAWGIIPFQDLLELDNSARMNTPGTTEGNWTWTWNGEISDLVKLEEKLKKLTVTADRR